MFDGWLGFNPLAYTAVSATMQLLLLGWLTQLALAVLYDRWLEPARPAEDGPAPTWPMVGLVLFNLGLPLVIGGQPGLVMLGWHWLGAAAALGAILQLLAGLIFVYDGWQRLSQK